MGALNERVSEDAMRMFLALAVAVLLDNGDEEGGESDAT